RRALVLVGDGGQPRLDVGQPRRVDAVDPQLGLDLRVADKLAREPGQVQPQGRLVTDGEREPSAPTDEAVDRFAHEPPLGRAQLARAAERATDDRGRGSPVTGRQLVDFDDAATYVTVAGGGRDGDAVRRVSGL